VRVEYKESLEREWMADDRHQFPAERPREMKMMRGLPAIVTILLIGSALVLLTQRERLSAWKLETKPAASPEDIVWRMSDAIREGDVQAYLDCFSGALKQNLQRTADDMGEAQFSQYLKKLNDEETGIAVSDLEQTNEQTATLKVEFVFRGRNEVQKHSFELLAGAWKITQVDGAVQVKTLIPYGADASGKE
jgi:hypothetical protein